MKTAGKDFIIDSSIQVSLGLTSTLLSQNGVSPEWVLLFNIVGSIGANAAVSKLAKGSNTGTLDDWLKDMSPEDAAKYNAWRSTRDGGLDYDKIDEILQMPKGTRPNPSEYLSPEYIESHLKNFDNGGSILVTGNAYDRFMDGKPYIGFSDNSQFLAPSNSINELIESANGDLGVIEEALGFEPGYFSDQGGLIQIEVNNLDNLNLRPPSGNEMGANDLWTPGGYTSGGTVEAIVDQIPNNSEYITIKPIK